MSSLTDFAKIGLNDEESQVYEGVIANPETSVQRLSRVVGMPRTTTYRILDKLVDMGLLVWVIGERGRKITYADEGSLDHLLQTKEAEISEFRIGITNLKNRLRSVEKVSDATEVRYYTGKEGARQMLWNMLRADGDMVGYTEFGQIELVGENFYRKWLDEFRLRKLRDRVLVNAKYVDQIKHNLKRGGDYQLSKSDIRILPNGHPDISGDHTLYNDVYSIMYWTAGRIVGIEVENRELAKLHRGIFEVLWKSGRGL